MSTQATPDNANAPLRCLLQQAAMPKFRIPFYRALTQMPELDVEILYGAAGLPNVDAPDLHATFRRVKRLPGGLFYDADHMRKISGPNYDAVSMSWNTRYLTLFPGIKRAKKNGMGVVLWGHGYSKNEGALRSWLRFKAAEAADAICLYTPDIAEKYIERGIPKERVFVALNSLDQTPIQAARDACLADGAALEAFRAEHGFDKGPMILFVSRLYEPNRVDLLIEAARRLRPDHPELRVVVVGKGPDEERLKRLCTEAGMDDRVLFTGAIYDEADIAPYFCSATAFCYPQNIGLSILHAMGYGVPVVTSDKIENQNPEIIALEHERTGLLYEHGSVDALAGALRRTIEDAELHGRMSAAAHETATQKFSIERMAGGMADALKFAAGRAQSRTGRA